LSLLETETEGGVDAPSGIAGLFVLVVSLVHDLGQRSLGRSSPDMVKRVESSFAQSGMGPACIQKVRNFRWPPPSE